MVHLSSELEASLREFAAAGPAELRENGARVAPLSTLSWEVRGNGDKPLLHLWSENHNLTRRVLAITDHSEQRLALTVECFGRSKPDRLEFLRIEFDRSERELCREAFAQSIRRLCEHEFPDETLESVTTAADTRHPLYRTQAERWLEFLVREDVTRVDATLDSRFGYSQIVASSAGEHGILDVLSVTRSGRLAILELKTVEHPVFLLQAAKYWLRIRRHLEQDDFVRYGYFPATALQPSLLGCAIVVLSSGHRHPAEIPASAT